MSAKFSCASMTADSCPSFLSNGAAGQSCERLQAKGGLQWMVGVVYGEPSIAIEEKRRHWLMLAP